MQPSHDGKEGYSKGKQRPLSTLIYSIAQSLYETSVRKNQPDETDKHIADATDAIARWTARLVYVGGFTVVVGLLTVAVLWKQWQTFEKTDETLRAAQRPWIQVSVEIGPRGLFYNSNGANLDLIFSLRNVGNSPALGAKIINGPLIDDVKENDAHMEAERLCDKERKKETNLRMVGDPVFQGSPWPIERIYTFSVLSRDLFISPRVSGCIDYVSPYGTRHQSRFFYNVVRPNGSGGMMAISPAGGNMAPKDLLMVPGIEVGDFYAD